MCESDSCQFPQYTRHTAWSYGCRCTACVEFKKNYSNEQNKTRRETPVHNLNQRINAINRRMRKDSLPELGFRGHDIVDRFLATTHCECCGKKFENWKDSRLDHHHASGKLRGFLCHHCNVALGSFDDDPQKLINAINYLERSKDGQEQESEAA